MKAHEKALNDLRVARAREERLRQQMDLIDQRAEEAIAVEERNIEELEQAEVRETINFSDASGGGLALNLSPATWSALEGFDDDYWDLPAFVPAENG